MKTKTVIIISVKIIALIGVLIGCNLYLDTLSAEVANELALYQMTDAPDSSSVLHWYTMLTNNLWLILTMLSLLLFSPELIYCTKHIINKHRKDNNHDKNI